MKISNIYYEIKKRNQLNQLKINKERRKLNFLFARSNKLVTLSNLKKNQTNNQMLHRNL